MNPYDLMINLSTSCLVSQTDSSCGYFGLLATIATQENSAPGQRWMHVIEHTTHSKAFFLTHKDSQKIEEIKKNPNCTLTLSTENNQSVITMKGKADVLPGLK